MSTNKYLVLPCVTDAVDAVGPDYALVAIDSALKKTITAGIKAIESLGDAFSTPSVAVYFQPDFYLDVCMGEPIISAEVFNSLCFVDADDEREFRELTIRTDGADDNQKVCHSLDDLQSAVGFDGRMECCRLHIYASGVEFHGYIKHTDICVRTNVLGIHKDGALKLLKTKLCQAA